MTPRFPRPARAFRLQGRARAWVSSLALLAALCWAVSAPAAGPGPLVVRVLPNPEVFGEEFTLGEIAEMDGFDLAALRALSQTVIGASPRPGQAIALNELLIRSRLAGWQGPPIQLTVPPQARVERAGQVVPGEDIARMVLDHAERAAAGQKGKEVKQQVVGTVRDAVIPKGRVEWQTELQGRHMVQGGNRIYSVTAMVEGKPAWHSLVHVRQKVFDEVVVARRPIRRGQIIAENDLERVRKNVSANRGDPFLTETRQAVGKRALRPIGVREPLRRGVVTAPAAVGEGGRVFVVYRTDGLVLSVPGVALVEGKVGQFIPVRNLSSGKIVHGILEADETVRVN